MKYFFLFYHLNGMGRTLTFLVFPILSILCFIYGAMGDVPSVYAGFIFLGIFLFYLVKCWLDETWDATYKVWENKKAKLE